MANQLLATGTNAQERAEFRKVVMEYRNTHSINATATHFSVSRTFVCKWQKRYRLDSSDVQERSKRPQNCARAYTEDEKTAIKSSLLIGNEVTRKRNKLVPTIYRNSVMLINRSYASIKRLTNKLIGQCKRSVNPRSKKKVRTGRVDASATVPGEIVQVDMKCVPTKAVVRTRVSDEARKEALIQAAHQHMESMMNKLAEQECAYPSISIIKYLRDECRLEYEKCVDDIQNSALEPEKDLKLYQYTAVDVKSRWSFRWMFSEHSELASLRFAMELLRAAPFAIRCVQTDNGSEFVSDYLAGHDCL